MLAAFIHIYQFFKIVEISTFGRAACTNGLLILCVICVIIESETAAFTANKGVRYYEYFYWGEFFAKFEKASKAG